MCRGRVPDLQKDESKYSNLAECPRRRRGAEDINGQVNPKDAIFGVWLPHGLSTDKATFDTQIKKCLARAKAIEDAFAQLESVPSGILTLKFERPAGVEEGVSGDLESVLSGDTDQVLMQQVESWTSRKLWSRLDESIHHETDVLRRVQTVPTLEAPRILIDMRKDRRAGY